jgi:hypothetical protein
MAVEVGGGGRDSGGVHKPFENIAMPQGGLNMGQGSSGIRSLFKDVALLVKVD